MVTHVCLCVCVCVCVCLSVYVSVCLSAAVRPHYCTDLDVTWGRNRGCPPSCALLGGFAIGARVALLWQHNVNPSYKLVINKLTMASTSQLMYDALQWSWSCHVTLLNFGNCILSLEQ